MDLYAATVTRSSIERVWTGLLARPDFTLVDAGLKIAAEPGARNQVAGHAFELLDVGRYNLRRLVDGHRLELCRHPHAPGYDAYRFIDGAFAGGVQHKLGGRTALKAISRLEHQKPGSSRYATLRVPADQLDVATRAASGRMRVHGSELTRADVYGTVDRGAEQLARYGDRATSALSQLGRAAGRAAFAGALIGGVLDLRNVKRGELTVRHHSARRGVDAVEGAATVVGTSGLVYATTTAATYIAVAGGTGAATAITILSAPVWVVPAAASLVVGGAVHMVTQRIRKRLARRFSKRASEAEVTLLDNAPSSLRESSPNRLAISAAAALLVLPAKMWVPEPPMLWHP